MTGEKVCRSEVQFNEKLVQFWFRSLDSDHQVHVVHEFQVV